MTTTHQTPTADIAVLGAGSYGSALAICLARNNNNTLMWAHNPEHVAQLKKDGSNEKYLPGAKFPDTLTMSDDLASVVAATKTILVVVPSFAFVDML